MDNRIIGQECEFYNEGHCLCYSDETHYPHCLNYPNCYYKQLLAEQAKNKKLVEVLTECADGFDDDPIVILAQQALNDVNK